MLAPVNPRVLPGAEPFRFDAGPRGALLIHGFTGCPASMRPMGRWLSDRGISTVGPRLPGHGTTWQDLETTSWRDWEREAERALTELSARCPDAIVVGLSMGGALALHLAASHPDRLNGVAVINADVRRPELALAPLVRLFSRTVGGVGNDISRPGQDEIVYDRVPVEASMQLRKLYKMVQRELPSLRVPLLVFSSTTDHVVKPSNSAYIFQRAGSTRKEMIRLANSFHVATLDHDAEAISRRILEFARDTAGTSSSAAG
jgi:carboxylesterase